MSAFHALAADFGAASALRSTSPPAGLHSASLFMRTPPLNPRYRSLTGLRGGDEQAVGRVGDRRHRRHQLGALGVEVPQCLDPAVRAFRRAGVVAGHDAAGGGDEIGLAVPAAHAALGTQHLAHLVSGGREPAGQVFMVK